MKIKVLLLFFLMTTVLTLNSLASGKVDEFYYQNAVFHDEIKSVKLFRQGNELSNPVIE